MAGTEKKKRDEKALSSATWDDVAKDEKLDEMNGSDLGAAQGRPVNSRGEDLNFALPHIHLGARSQSTLPLPHIAIFVVTRVSSVTRLDWLFISSSHRAVLRFVFVFAVAAQIRIIVRKEICFRWCISASAI
ncbi:uncharacterized protein LOC129289882 [Prosopis cineraria]|uniref:uncharacterized protein LOC129289882 n=1 Tax=Prosopis cineraria TaxID=364024 RepID=UPI00240FA0AB|nr:uncharacterized protein LOC129289882 [Prosopis cineraria]